MAGQTLHAFLRSGGFAEHAHAGAIAGVIMGLAAKAVAVRKLTKQGALIRGFAASRGETNAGGDTQKDLDVIADGMFLEAARNEAIALYGSEENNFPILLDPDKPLALAIDPLDGSSNIETNVSIGTIFSILPVQGDPRVAPEASFLQSGRNQLAAGFFIYGPQLALALTVGSGTRIFVHSPKLGDFVEAYDAVSIPGKTGEFAINASNYRHWEDPVRLWVDDCLAGTDGPRERDFNMRWIASLVAETYRILVRGGVFLYPGDRRKGYSAGRLRLVYEANPIAFLVEQAGGKATDTVNRILDLVPVTLHQRTPLVFGSGDEVERIARYHVDPAMISDRSPLFGKRGLFRV
ncbi:class 1 fructose-bisphosphatase [Zhengella sp. ZM62]|uniref:class 1 fructose-bisphosphatase n=1 Tax=Zhengella sedimenti TaxID=3390035 RepID=UPI003976DEC7